MQMPPSTADNGVRGFVGWFVTPLGSEESDTVRRGRFFVIACFTLAATALPFCVLNYLSEHRVSPSVIAFLIGIPLMAANPFLLRAFRAPPALAVIASLELLAALVVMTYAHGGVDSAAAVWFAAIPFLAGVSAGHRVAVGIAIVALGAIASLFVLQWNGHVFPRPLSDDAMLLWKFGGVAGSIGFMAAMVVLYERQTSTALRQRSAQVEFRQSLIKGIVDSALDAVIAFTSDGTIRSWDGSAQKMFGWTREQAVGKNLFRMLTGVKKRSTTHDGLLRRLQETEAQRVFSERTELEAVDKRGAALQVEMSISPAIHINDTTLYTAFVRDLTKARRGRERVKRLRHDLNQVIEQTPDGMALFEGSELVFANGAWRAWFHNDPATADARHGLATLAIDDDRELLRDAIVRAEQSRQPAHLGEFRFTAADSRIMTLDVHFVPSVRFQGVESVLFVARDVTEQRLMRDRLTISDRMATMGTLLAGVAHEINNPLTYVMGNLSLIEAILEEDTTDGRQRAVKAARDADEGAIRISEIVRDMQRLCTVDNGKPEPVDPRIAIRSALKIAENRTKHAAVVHVEQSAVPFVLGSVSRIGQVVLNLVVNAAQAFKVKDLDKNTIHVRTWVDQQRVCIEVQDNADGISPTEVARIFDPFFTTKPTGEGTGLGLWISQKIVESLGGELAVESELGVGTRFRIWLDTAPMRALRTLSPGWAQGSRNHDIEVVRSAVLAPPEVPNPPLTPDIEFSDYEPTPTPTP